MNEHKLWEIFQGISEDTIYEIASNPTLPIIGDPLFNKAYGEAFTNCTFTVPQLRRVILDIYTGVAL